MLSLRQLHIRRYRALKEDTRLTFGDGPVFLLGRNGSGKSSLLELLAALTSMDLRALVYGEPAPAPAPESLDISWTLELATEEGGYQLDCALEVDHGDEEDSFRWPEDAYPRHPSAYEFSLELYSNPQGPGESADAPTQGRLLSLHVNSAAQIVMEPSDYAPSAGTSEPTPHPFQRTFLRLLSQLGEGDGTAQTPEKNAPIRAALRAFADARQHLPARFDEALDTFGRIFRQESGPALEPSAMVMRAPALVGQDRPEIFRRFVPHDLNSARFEDADSQEEISIESSREKLPLASAPSIVDIFSHALGAESVRLNPYFAGRDNKGVSTWKRFDLAVEWPGGAIHRQEELSFGQKRLLSFLWYQAVAPHAPIFADELTNGLHATWLDDLVDRIGDRQAFHATQNPLLLDHYGPGEEEEIRSGFVFCDVTTVDGQRQWTARNPSAEEAARLRKHWKAGYETLSQLLLNLGMW